MPIKDIKAFADKYYGKPTKPEEIARLENVSLPDVKEALEFIGLNAQITWPLKIQMWDQEQYAKQHPYVPPPPAPGAVPTVFGPSGVAQRTMAMQTETEFWKRMEDLIDTRINAAVEKIIQRCG